MNLGDKIDDCFLLFGNGGHKEQAITVPRRKEEKEFTELEEAFVLLGFNELEVKETWK